VGFRGIFSRISTAPAIIFATATKFGGRGASIARCARDRAGVTPVVNIDEMRRYGYQWYLGSHSYSVPEAPRWNRLRLARAWMALGNGGQRLYLFPDLQLAIAVTAGNCDHPAQAIPPTRLSREVVLPSVR
jgi:CubicO group peptidase (beta-lactamase class C family)